MIFEVLFLSTAVGAAAWGPERWRRRMDGDSSHTETGARVECDDSDEWEVERSDVLWCPTVLLTPSVQSWCSRSVNKVQIFACFASLEQVLHPLQDLQRSCVHVHHDAVTSALTSNWTPPAWNQTRRWRASAVDWMYELGAWSVGALLSWCFHVLIILLCSELEFELEMIQTLNMSPGLHHLLFLIPLWFVISLDYVWQVWTGCPAASSSRCSLFKHRLWLYACSNWGDLITELLEETFQH